MIGPVSCASHSTTAGSRRSASAFTLRPCCRSLFALVLLVVFETVNSDVAYRLQRSTEPGDLCTKPVDLVLLYVRPKAIGLLLRRQHPATRHAPRLPPLVHAHRGCRVARSVHRFGDQLEHSRVLRHDDRRVAKQRGEVGRKTLGRVFLLERVRTRLLCGSFYVVTHRLLSRLASGG